MMGAGALALLSLRRRVETLLCFLGQCYRVVSPGEVLCDVHTQELGATHSLHSRTFDGQSADYVEC